MMKAVLTVLGVLLAVTNLSAKDWQVGARIKIDDDTYFGIRGKNKDGYVVKRNGKALCSDWLHDNVDEPGELKPEDVEVSHGSRGDVTIAFRFGKNDDVLYCIAIRGEDAYTNQKEYWRHPNHSKIEISIKNGDTVVFNVPTVSVIDEAGQVTTAKPKHDVELTAKFGGKQWHLVKPK